MASEDPFADLLPEGILSAIAQVESGGNPNAVSPKGALGLFQFMPATARQYGINPMDPDQARQGAQRYLSDLSSRYGGDIRKVLAAYNWGPGNLERIGLGNAPKETRDYIGKVLSHLVPAAQAQDDPFADLKPESASTQDPFADLQPATQDPFADLQPAEPTPDTDTRGQASPWAAPALPGTIPPFVTENPLALLQKGYEAVTSKVREYLPAPVTSALDVIGEAGKKMGEALPVLSVAPATRPALQALTGLPKQAATVAQETRSVAGPSASIPEAVAPPVEARGPLGAAGAEEVPLSTRIAATEPSELLQEGVTTGKITGLNLDKLNTEEDVKAALSNIEQAFPEVELARGAPVTWKQTAKDVKALLGDVNMDAFMKQWKTPGEGAARIRAAKGMLIQSAEETTRLAKAAAGGDAQALDAFAQSLNRTLMIQQTVARGRAEAGRMLQILRQPVPAMRWKEALTTKLEAVGGEDRLKKAAEIVKDMEDAASPAAIGRIAQASRSDMIYELWVNNVLSGPWTHAMNVASNSLYSVLNVAERRVAHLINKDVALPVGTLKAIPEAFRAATESFRTEITRLPTKLEARRGAIPGRLGRIIRIPSRALQAEDAFFQTLAYRGHLNALAFRQAAKEDLPAELVAARAAELAAAPTEAMMDDALEEAARLTFTSDLGDIGMFFSRLANLSSGKHAFKPIKYILPFVRTPANILSAAVERSPLALLMPETRMALRMGGEDAALAMTRMVMGTGLMALAAKGVKEGFITGSAPKDKEERAVWYAAGNKPYSIRVGGEWIAYNRMDPMGSIMGWTADAANAAVDQESLAETGLLVLGSAAESLLNKSMLSGASSFADLLSDPSRYAADYAARLMSGFIPFSSAMRQAATAIDPTLRQPESALDIRPMIPIASMGLTGKRDLFGEPIDRGRAPAGVPIPRDAKPSPEAQALAEYKVYPSIPPKTISIGKEEVDLTVEQQARLAELIGTERKRFIAQYMEGTVWERADAVHRAHLLELAISKGRERGMRRFKSEYTREQK